MLKMTFSILIIICGLILAQIPPHGNFEVKPYNDKVYKCVKNNKVIWASTSEEILYYSEDYGRTIRDSFNFHTNFSQNIRNAFICSNGNIIVVNDSLIYYSINNGKEFKLATDTVNGKPIRCNYWLSSNSIDEGNNNVIFAEYGNDGPDPDGTMKRYIWRSKNYGVTWEKILSQSHQPNAQYDTSFIRHFHTCHYIAKKNIWLATSGDNNTSIKWFISFDNGDNWMRIGNTFSQDYRTLAVEYAQNNELMWGTDNTTPNSKNAIISINWEQLFNSERILNKLILHDGQVYNFWIYDNQVLFTQRVAPKTNFAPKIYYSNNLGTNWEVVLEWYKTNSVSSAGFENGCGIDDSGRVYIPITSNLVGYPYINGIIITFPERSIISVPEKKITSNSLFDFQNYPNPFNTTTRIKYFIDKDCFVNVRFYNSIGSPLGFNYNKLEKYGEHEINFDGKSLASGVYFCMIKIKDKIKIIKMILIK